MPTFARPRRAQLHADFTGFEIEVEGDPHPEVIDPAVAAASMLLRRAMAAAGAGMQKAGRNENVCLVVAPLQWTDVVRDAWKETVRRGERYEDGLQGRSWNEDRWLAWAPVEQPSGPERQAHIFAMAVWRGSHVFALSSDPGWLPVDLVAAADHCLKLPALTGAEIDMLAGELSPGCQAATAFTDEEAAALTPRTLRLARRPRQTPAGYIGKLRDILARDAPIEAAGRKEPPPFPRATPSLDRLHGIDAAVQRGRALAADIAGYRAGILPWSAVGGGCLLSGPLGTGKTLFACALAETCGAPLVTGSHGTLGTGTGHQGDLLRSMRKCFADVLKGAPSIIVLDEIDSFPNRSKLRHVWADWEIQVVNELLAEIDGAGGREGVVVIGACNHPDKLDSALVRTRRLDRHIHVGLPDTTVLVEIIREHLGSDLPGIDLSLVALAAAGATGADCEQMVRGGHRSARIAGRPMEIRDLEEEVLGDWDASEHDRWTAAVHEAGQAVAECILRPGSLLAVSLRGGAASGGRGVSRGRSRYPLAADIHAQMVSILSGRAAEKAVIWHASAGAGGGADSDLAQATTIATAAAVAFGFSEIGLTWQGRPDAASLPEILRDPLVSASVGAALNRAMADALLLMHDHREAVIEVARTLLLRSALDGVQVAKIVAGAAGGVS